MTDGYGMLVWTWAGVVMVIMPPHMQVQVDVLFNAGIPPSMTVADPGAQGATVLGMHGIGVNTPNAAAVADATVGLARDMHTPNVGMFTSGLLSMMFAAGVPIIVLLVGSTLSALGAAPNVHIIIDPVVTKSGIVASRLDVIRGLSHFRFLESRFSLQHFFGNELLSKGTQRPTFKLNIERRIRREFALTSPQERERESALPRDPKRCSAEPLQNSDTERVSACLFGVAEQAWRATAID